SARGGSCRRSGSTDAAWHRCRARRRWAIRARDLAKVCPSVTTINSAASVSPARQGRARSSPALYRATIGVSDGACLGLFPALGERRVDFVFLDPGGRIAALTEILLFGAVAHHAGMLRRFLAGIVGRCLGIGFVAHF